MKYSVFIIMVLVCAVLAKCTSSSNRNLEYISILYDRSQTLRIVPLKSNDLVRWSVDPDKYLLSRMDVWSADSIFVFKQLLESMRPDSSVRINSVMRPTVLSMDDRLEISFYKDENDIQADAMIVYHYSNSPDNDTLFIDYTLSNFRINNLRAEGDTLLRRKILSFLQLE